MPRRGLPPDPPPPLDPSLVAGGPPTTTLGKQVARWYENAGGIDEAVARAQEAQRNRDPKVLDSLLWPQWKESSVTQIPVLVDEVPGLSNGGRGNGGTTGQIWGEYDFDGSVSINTNSPHRQSTLEHELGHASYSGTPRLRRGIEQGMRERRWGDSWADTTFQHYWSDPGEVDVRLAEIKRRYAQHTGKLVTTPEDAREAWDWWRKHEGKFRPEYNATLKAPIERPEDTPTLTPRAFEFYDTRLPDDVKEQLMHRMPELVRTEDRIRRLMGA